MLGIQQEPVKTVSHSVNLPLINSDESDSDDDNGGGGGYCVWRYNEYECSWAQAVVCIVLLVRERQQCLRTSPSIH